MRMPKAVSASCRSPKPGRRSGYRRTAILVARGRSYERSNACQRLPRAFGVSPVRRRTRPASSCAGVVVPRSVNAADRARPRRRFLRGLVGAAAAVRWAAVATAAEPRPRPGGSVSGRVCLYSGEALGRYGFPDGHPLGEDRQGAFLREASARGLDKDVSIVAAPRANRAEIERFHTRSYVDRVLH